MSREIRITEKIMSTPYKDHEHPSIRFNIKETEKITNHLLFYKTDNEKTFLDERKPTDILIDMLMEIQNLPKINNKEDKNDIETFNNFIEFITPFIPHLLINSNSKTNVVEIDDNNEITLEQLNEVFKIASKSKRKAMLISS